MNHPNEFSHLECADCKKSDRLYRDAHGVFCHRCGPSVPVHQNYSGGNLNRFATIDTRKK